MFPSLNKNDFTDTVKREILASDVRPVRYSKFDPYRPRHIFCYDRIAPNVFILLPSDYLFFFPSFPFLRIPPFPALDLVLHYNRVLWCPICERKRRKKSITRKIAKKTFQTPVPSENFADSKIVYCSFTACCNVCCRLTANLALSHSYYIL